MHLYEYIPLKNCPTIYFPNLTRILIGRSFAIMLTETFTPALFSRTTDSDSHTMGRCSHAF
jgi:hypothetical protein